MIVFLAVILFVLSGCEKQQPESESEDSIPTINIGISARTGLSKNLSEVNQTLGDLTEEKIGVRARRACPACLDRTEQQPGKQLL